MSRVIDTAGLRRVRSSLISAESDLTIRARSIAATLDAVGHPNVGWRLGSVASWLDRMVSELTDRIDIAELITWLQIEPGTAPPPPPVRTWDAFSRAMPSYAASHLASLHPAEQRLIATWRPASIARLAGAPIPARVAANRRFIQDSITELDNQAAELRAQVDAGSDEWWKPALLAQLAEQRQVLERLARRNPIWFDGQGDGKYAEWIGPADAGHVVILVPGTGNDLWSADGLAERARLMQSTASALTADGVAVVVGMAYDAPDTIPAAGSSSYANHGGPELAGLIDSLALGGDPHVTVLGHSYGSYAAARALEDIEPGTVDDLIVVGSPGIGVDSADELPIEPGHVWAGLTDNDTITLTSVDRWLTWVERLDPNPFDWTTWDVRRDGTYENLWFGRNPAHPEFGAIRLEMFDADGHSGYFGAGEHDRPALENLARVFVGIEPVVE